MSYRPGALGSADEGKADSSLDLPDTSTATGIEQAQETVLLALGNGQLLPGEANVLAGIVEARRKALETAELERRITQLEEMK